jgi:hypothetical protein
MERGRRPDDAAQMFRDRMIHGFRHQGEIAYTAVLRHSDTAGRQTWLKRRCLGSTDDADIPGHELVVAKAKDFALGLFS